jgi:DNA-binding winged helix-turn-helix (wHTH) protein
MSTSPDKYYVFDDYRLSVGGDVIKLYSGRHQVQLKPDEARVLRKLFENRQTLVEKATLLRELGTEDEGVLRKVVLGLRKAVSDPKEEERIIRTERGKGYLFVADAWPVPSEVFHANIDRPRTTAEVNIESAQAESVAASLAAEAKEEEPGAQPDAASPPPEADEEHAPVETDATPTQPPAENEPRTPSGNSAPPPASPPATGSTDGLNTFGKWMLGPGLRLTAFALVCVFVVFALSVKGYLDEWEGLHALVSGAQLILLFIALTYSIPGPHSFKRTGPALTENIKNSTGYDDPVEWGEASLIAERVLERYKSYWRGLLITWFFLYLGLTLTGLPGIGLNCPIDGSRFCVGGMANPKELAVRLQQDQSNKVSALVRGELSEPMRQELNDYRGSQPPPAELEHAIVDALDRVSKYRTLYYADSNYFDGLGLSKEIREQSARSGGLPDEELRSLNRTLLLKAYPESAQKELIRTYSIGLRILSTLLNNATSLLIFLCFHILNMPTKLKSGTGRVSDAYLYAGVALVSIMALAEGLMVIYSGSPQNRHEVLQGWSYVSGFFGGVAMALYFGRLQSVFVGAPKWFVVLLFVYTLIQSLFFFLEERESVGVAVVLIDFALLMKCLLFLYMNWLFESGRLLFYLVRVRRTYKRVSEEFPIFRRVLDEES